MYDATYEVLFLMHDVGDVSPPCRFAGNRDLRAYVRTKTYHSPDWTLVSLDLSLVSFHFLEPHLCTKVCSAERPRKADLLDSPIFIKIIIIKGSDIK